MIPPVVVGSASRDITAADPRGWRLGGAAAYAGLTLARLGLRPRILLGVDDEAASAAELELLREAGANLRLVRLREGPVFENREAPGGRVQTCLAPGVAIPADRPTGWGDASAWLLLPVADELPPDWAEVPSAGALVAVGWQGLLRSLPRGGIVARRPPEVSPLLERAGIVGVSHNDVGPDVPVAELEALLRRPTTLLLTAGEAGGTAIDLRLDGSRRVRRWPSIATASVMDPTGAGDTFLAALVAARLGHPLAGSGRGGADLRLAAAVASLVVEGPGLLGVPGLPAIAARLRSSLPGRAGDLPEGHPPS